MRISAALLIGTSTFAFAAPAMAQTHSETVAQAANQPPATEMEGQGEIIVTATKRASRVHDVPFSINAQTQQDIQRANAQTLEDISRNVAGLTVQNLGPGQSQVSIRGVSAGQIVRDQPGVKEQVGIYLDESVTSLSLFTPDFDLFDLNRVETLRGPQGTLFGSGSVGGTIRYITNQPKIGRVEGSVEGNANVLSGGSFGASLKGAINIPLAPTAAMRIVGYGTHFGGFIDSVGPYRKKDVNDGDRYGTRVSLLWQPIEQIKVTPRIVYQKVTAGGFNREEHYNLYDNQFTSGPAGRDLGRRKQYLKMRERFEDRTLLADLTMSYTWPVAELTSVTSYLDRNILVSRDASALTGSVGVTPFLTRPPRPPVFPTLDPRIVNLTSNLRDTTKLQQLSQELRLASVTGSPFQWVVGGFVSQVHRNYKQRLPTPGYDAFIDAATFPGLSALLDNGFGLVDNPYHANLPYIIRQGALFGEASYKLNQFKLTAGGRYYSFHEKRDFISGGIFSNYDTRIGDKTKSTGFSPRGIISWEPNRNFSVNLQAAKGFRLGGVNDPLNIPLCSAQDQAIYGPFAAATYKDETLWNYEGGVKYSKGPFSANAAVFHSAIKNLQVTVDAGSCSSRLVFNVPKAHTTGFEGELSARPLPGLDFSLAGSYVDAKFDSTIANPILATRTGIRRGNRLPTVPKYQVAATATYGTRLSSNNEWYVNGSVQRVGSRFTQPGDQEPGAGVFNFIFFDPNTLAYGLRDVNFGSLKLPPYTLVNASAGVKWDSGLEVVGYVTNIFDVDPKLSLDRERGGRARLGYNVGQPRTIGLTVRQSFGRNLVEAAPPPVVPPPPPPPAAATQTCANGSMILATDACPAPPPPPPPPPAERG